jgi:hypothetical protein
MRVLVWILYPIAIAGALLEMTSCAIYRAVRQAWEEVGRKPPFGGGRNSW